MRRGQIIDGCAPDGRPVQALTNILFEVGDIGKVVDVYEPGEEPTHVVNNRGPGFIVKIEGLTTGEVWPGMPVGLLGIRVQVDRDNNAPTEHIEMVPKETQLFARAAHKVIDRKHAAELELLRGTISKLRELLEREQDEVARLMDLPEQKPPLFNQAFVPLEELEEAKRQIIDARQARAIEINRADDAKLAAEALARVEKAHRTAAELRATELESELDRIKETPPRLVPLEDMQAAKQQIKELREQIAEAARFSEKLCQEQQKEIDQARSELQRQSRRGDDLSTTLRDVLEVLGVWNRIAGRAEKTPVQAAKEIRDMLEQLRAELRERTGGDSRPRAEMQEQINRAIEIADGHKVTIAELRKELAEEKRKIEMWVTTASAAEKRAADLEQYQGYMRTADHQVDTDRAEALAHAVEMAEQTIDKLRGQLDRSRQQVGALQRDLDQAQSRSGR